MPADKKTRRAEPGDRDHHQVSRIHGLAVALAKLEAAHGDLSGAINDLYYYHVADDKLCDTISEMCKEITDLEVEVGAKIGLVGSLMQIEETE